MVFFHVPEKLKVLGLDGSGASGDTTGFVSSPCSLLSCSQVPGGDQVVASQVQCSIRQIIIPFWSSLSGHTHESPGFTDWASFSRWSSSSQSLGRGDLVL